MRLACAALASIAALPFTSGRPARSTLDVLPALERADTRDVASIPVPVVLWHGLGDRYDAPGLLSLKRDLESRSNLEGIFVHIVEVGHDGASDQKATFFGNANAQIAQVCEQLLALPEITDPALNPSGKFDAIGFSQGGQLLRGVVERCGGPGGLNVRNLITLGSQHLGISALPPCPPNSSPFSPCRLMHLSLVHSSIYSSYAQNNIVPAQYFRNYANEGEMEKYLAGNSFLRDLNNERLGDEQGLLEDTPQMLKVDVEPRNATYKANLSNLSKLVLLRFSFDQTVVPATSAHFTLPAANASTNVPYDPLPLDRIPLYARDYIGLRTLDEKGSLVRGVCKGVHMEIGKKCWNKVVQFLGPERDETLLDQAHWSEFDDLDERDEAFVKLGDSHARDSSRLIFQI
ncbi:palmitoyl-protein thioesterase family protein [Sporobolomyces koalae]|uniref:palmitoyl-protein thioesterase family protein n=1 Tax=Sporobolomyces koalae TaxID=500713 RepID=UPI00317B377A